jgi:hypothetical protein
LPNRAEKPKTANLDVWLMLDEYGNYVVSPNERALTDLWRDEIGTEPANRRTVRLTLVADLPYGAHMTSELAETSIMQVLHERGYHRSSTRDAILIRNRC